MRVTVERGSGPRPHAHDDAGIGHVELSGETRAGGNPGDRQLGGVHVVLG